MPAVVRKNRFSLLGLGLFSPGVIKTDGGRYFNKSWRYSNYVKQINYGNSVDDIKRRRGRKCSIFAWASSVSILIIWYRCCRLFCFTMRGYCGDHGSCEITDILRFFFFFIPPFFFSRFYKKFTIYTQGSPTYGRRAGPGECRTNRFFIGWLNSQLRVPFGMWA